MNYKVNVKYRYLYANPTNQTVWVADLLNKYDHQREAQLEVWIENDYHYDPLRVFQVTQLEFNDKGQATKIKLTESGFKNG